MNGYLAEKCGMKLAVDADATSGAETARISMAKGDRVTLLLNLPSVATDLALTLRQHDAASGGNSKDLSVDKSYFKKVGAATEFTRVDPSALSASISDSDFNGAAGIIAVEVMGEDIDADNGFNHFSVQVGARATQVVGFYVVDEMRLKPAYKVTL